MDLNKIHYFLKAAELQNFTQAAKVCHIAQTTMSKYISVLEQELGCQLFIRQQKTAKLTLQGQQFYEGMKDISSQYQNLCQRIQHQKNEELRIGMITTDYEDFPMLRSFEKAFPHIFIYFSFGKEEKLLDDLRHHYLDALICPHILQNQFLLDDIVRIDLVTIDVSLVCSKELLLRYQTINDVIENQPLITKTTDQSYQNFCREKLLELYGKTFTQVEVVNNYPQQLLLLNLSRGFAIIPSQATSEYDNLVAFSIPQSFCETSQLLYQKEFMTESLQALLNHIHEEKC